MFEINPIIKKINIKKLFILLCYMIFLSPNLSKAAIDCRVPLNIQQSATNNFNLAPSDPIGKKQWVAENFVIFSCSGTAIAQQKIKIQFYINPLPTQGNTNVIQTSLRGVNLSYDISNSQLPSGCSLSGLSSTSMFSELTCHLKNDGTNTIRFFTDFYLIKDSNNIEQGRIMDLAPIKISYFIESEGISTAKEAHFTPTIQSAIEVNNRGCTLETKNINFNLGKTLLNDLTSSTKTHPINLTCYPNTRYFLQVDGVAELNDKGVIKLTPEPGVATGVGVQLLANGQPVEFGRAKQMGTSYTSGNNIRETIYITARYYQTEKTITAGPANASATFTMTYQ
ncbi:fimbrial protein [Yersinia massiliensis]|uniref:fimbrial protein n=1 Tax=Yersinia massiliensis TaxID=419257 RepID=UPI0021BD4951|nr:fimbrial protein [Yersinia massiliensis]